MKNMTKTTKKSSFQTQVNKAKKSLIVCNMP